MAEQINHTQKGIGRLATQFRESTNLIAYLSALLSEANTLEQVFQDLLEKRWIDTATGVNLDVLGAIVGQPRRLVDATFIPYFGFSPFASAQSFGTVVDAGSGGRFRTVDEVTTGIRTLTDTEYRLFIRAKVIKNSIIPTLNQTLQFLEFLFGIDSIYIVDQNMQYSVSFGRPLENDEKAIILNTDLVPKPSAVRVRYQEHEADGMFVLGNVRGGKGFGSVADPNIGGQFARLIN